MEESSVKPGKIHKLLKEYLLITLFILLFVFGTYFFKFPNNFAFGGVTGLSIVIAKFLPFTPSAINLIISMALLFLGFAFLGKNFGTKTVYASVLMSVLLWAMDYIHPIQAPLTDNKLLELIFAIFIPGFSSAFLFNLGASSGGTDIITMIIKKYSNMNIGAASFVSDVAIVISSFFIFDIETFLFSFLGLAAKALVIDNIIESINNSKVFNIICSDPEPICDYIVNKLHRSATTIQGEGAYSGKHKYIIFTAMKSYQAIMLRQYIHDNQPGAFILISNTSEIIGRGFGRNIS